jgi:NAD(P)-dependent dehydrogenase (short-subunit alcohol dehydrogenase family)
VLAEETKAAAEGRLPEDGAFMASLDLNLAAHYRMLLAALPRLEAMAQTGEDVSVTFISSINAYGGFAAPAYSAAKAGLHGLAAALAPVLGPLGIRVNVVAPGTTLTPLTQAEAAAANDPDRFARAAANAPLRRVATAADIAATVLSLALHLRHVTGQVLVADGGQTLQR